MSNHKNLPLATVSLITPLSRDREVKSFPSRPSFPWNIIGHLRLVIGPNARSCLGWGISSGCENKNVCDIFRRVVSVWRPNQVEFKYLLDTIPTQNWALGTAGFSSKCQKRDERHGNGNFQLGLVLPGLLAKALFHFSTNDSPRWFLIIISYMYLIIIPQSQMYIRILTAGPGAPGAPAAPAGPWIPMEHWGTGGTGGPRNNEVRSSLDAEIISLLFTWCSSPSCLIGSLHC